MLEYLLIMYCSPTLAGLKTGSLFNLKCKNHSYLYRQLQFWNQMLNKKGVHLQVLRRRSDSILIYVYRPDKLCLDLNKVAANDFLLHLGYHTVYTEDYIRCLLRRFASADGFPHEIGLFLGYPLEDVKSFIENEGQNYLFSGYWKVYWNAEEAKNLFCRYHECSQSYLRQFMGGSSVMKLTITE